MAKSTRCPHCNRLTAQLPSMSARVVVVGGAWLVAMVTLFIVAMMGPLMLAFLPISIPAGVGLISAAHGYAFSDATCDSCGKMYSTDGVRIAAAPEPTPALQVQPVAA
jgi:hypothetical protein